MFSYGSRLVFSCFFHSSKLVFMVFHGARSNFIVFHGFRLVVYGFRAVFMVPGRFFIFHVENTLKLYSGPKIQSDLSTLCGLGKYVRLCAHISAYPHESA